MLSGCHRAAQQCDELAPLHSITSSARCPTSKNPAALTVLFCSNPRGNNEEGFGDGRYSCFFDLDTWRKYHREKILVENLASGIGTCHSHEFRRSVQAYSVVPQ